MPKVICVWVDAGARPGTWVSGLSGRAGAWGRGRARQGRVARVESRGYERRVARRWLFVLVSVRSLMDRVVMILPQVHLRKPCYDFTFL